MRCAFATLIIVALLSQTSDAYITTTYQTGVDGYTHGEDTYLERFHPNRDATHGTEWHLRPREELGSSSWAFLYMPPPSNHPTHWPVISSTLRLWVSAGSPNGFRCNYVLHADWQDTWSWNTWLSFNVPVPWWGDSDHVNYPAETDAYYYIDTTLETKLWFHQNQVNHGWVIKWAHLPRGLGKIASVDHWKVPWRPQWTIVQARPGDADKDGDFDFDDILQILDDRFYETGLPAEWHEGDFDGDGDFDFDDIQEALANGDPYEATGENFNADWETAQEN